MKIEILNEVTLKDMNIKVEEINKRLFKSPFKLKEGKIGLISLDCSFEKIWNTAIKVKLENLELHVELKDPSNVRFSRTQEVEAAFAQFKAFIEEETTIKKEYSKGFVSSLLEKIFDNLQFELKNIKLVVFAPTVTDYPVLEFSFKAFNFKTVDKNGSVVFFDRNKSIYKNLPILKKINLEEIKFQIFKNKSYQKIFDLKKKKSHFNQRL